MDFDDTPAEAAFRAEAVAFLEANAQLKTGTDRDWSRGAVATDPVVQADYLAHCRQWLTEGPMYGKSREKAII